MIEVFTRATGPADATAPGTAPEALSLSREDVTRIRYALAHRATQPAIRDDPFEGPAALELYRKFRALEYQLREGGKTQPHPTKGETEA